MLLVYKCEVLMWKEGHNFQLADPELIQKTPNKGHARTPQGGLPKPKYQYITMKLRVYFQVCNF